MPAKAVPCFDGRRADRLHDRGRNPDEFREMIAPIVDTAWSRTHSATFCTSLRQREEQAIASQLDSSGIIDLGPLSGLVGYHLRRAWAAVGSDYFRTVEPGGTRQVLFGVLSVISANPGINQGNVGRILGVQRPNMVALVNELIGNGWVERTIDSVDRRAFILNLTPAGAEAITATLALIREHEERMLSDLSAQERRTLIHLLGRVEARGE